MTPVTLLSELARGWHPDPADPDRERYFDGARWTSETRGGVPVAPRPAPGWYEDPDDAGRLRYFDGLDWTCRLMPRPGALPPWLRRAQAAGAQLARSGMGSGRSSAA